MPEVWLHLGVDYDHDGKISPFGGRTMRSHPRRAISSSAASTGGASS
jgi:membrane-bound lytic murein transglycosylase B